MDEIITKVSKITNVKKSRIHDVINRNLDKIDDPHNIYKFAAYQCKGIVNMIGLCWGISLIQFISPISEDIEIDNILSVLNKYCSWYGTGGTREDDRIFLYNFTNELRKVDPRLLGLYSDCNVLIRCKDKKSPLVFSEQNIIVFTTGGRSIVENIDIELRNSKDYEIYSILIHLSNYRDNLATGHAICLRMCNKTLFLFDNDDAYKISSFNLSDVMKDAMIILTVDSKLFKSVHFKKEKAFVHISAVLLKHKQHHLCLEKISKQYNVDEIYVNNLV
jgi:hypothetical protein